MTPDPITVNEKSGVIVLLEDVGGAAHNGKVWLYDPPTDSCSARTERPSRTRATAFSR
jgi:hypothetical protein